MVSVSPKKHALPAAVICYIPHPADACLDTLLCLIYTAFFRHCCLAITDTTVPAYPFNTFHIHTSPKHTVKQVLQLFHSLHASQQSQCRLMIIT